MFPLKTQLKSLSWNKLHKATPILKRIFCSSCKDDKDQTVLLPFNFDECCEKLINQQINLEFQASFAYLSMASYCNQHSVALPGFYKLFTSFSKEEFEHGQKFVDYMNLRGGIVVLSNIKAPDCIKWTIESAIFTSIDLEKQVTQHLHMLHDKASEKKDLHLCKFLEDEFIAEQYQALKDLCDLFTQVKRCGDKLGLQIVDNTILNKFRDPKFSAHSSK